MHANQNGKKISCTRRVNLQGIKSSKNNAKLPLLNRGRNTDRK